MQYVFLKTRYCSVFVPQPYSRRTNTNALRSNFHLLFLGNQAHGRVVLLVAFDRSVSATRLVAKGKAFASVLPPPPFMGGATGFRRMSTTSPGQMGGARPPHFAGKNPKWGGRKARKCPSWSVFYTIWAVFLTDLGRKPAIFPRASRAGNRLLTSTALSFLLMLDKPLQRVATICSHELRGPAVFQDVRLVFSPKAT